MKNKLWRIFLSVGIALALWFYVISVVSPESEETFYDIPVSYQNDILDERGLMIVSDTPTVTLRLKGNRSDLNELNPSNITILLDLAAIQAPGTQMLKPTVSYPANLPNNAFETLSQTPNLLLLKVENKLKKAVPVQLDYMDTKVPEEFIADKENPVLDVSYVEVSGPESVVSQIDRAMIQIDLTNQTDSIVGTFDYVLCDANGEPVDAQMVTTNVENVNLSVKIQRVKEVPLLLNLVEGGGATVDTCKVELSKGSIWVSGNENMLKDLDVIELGTVNLADLKAETNELTFDLLLPDGVTNETGETQITAVITFPALATKKLTITKDQFLATGVPAQYTVNWITEMVEVELRGPKDLVKSLTEEDIMVIMDFTQEEIGIISKLPRITMSGGYESVGAISVTAVTANMQMGDPDATVG